ncbi:MAG: chromosome partition protein Smc [Pirellulaceae bacterium]|nr:MAG: chromosome partition protein Smc [Pirellulaceae bacterium]
MLIALELVGFKSFADKTRFEFPDGITVIVGPNGSGKSNVVDAIKWVLGAQSAKSLRGGEMLDVIFKGSASSGRKAANSAEATLVFDNSKQQLPIDAPQVEVTRRVYRSGEGEYLINGQACRLKDIKNLFRGTGVGVDAYSLIEQGKVDRMLQASPKDRRLIFEEAAGISRFNAKKAEALRRLQRVEQNLTRLKDIVEEVHTRLRTLQSQASKAQRYRESTARLEELRLRLGHTELVAHESRVAKCSDEVDRIQQDLAQRQTELQQAVDAARAAEMNLHQVAGACQRVENRLQEVMQRIAVARNQQHTCRLRLDETLEERRRLGQRLIVLRARAEQVEADYRQAQQALLHVEQTHRQCLARQRESQERTEKLRSAIERNQRRYESLRQEHIQCLQQTSTVQAELTKTQSVVQELDQLINHTEQRLAENRTAEEEARHTAEQAARALQEVHQRSQKTNTDLTAARNDLEEYRDRAAMFNQRAATLKERLSATTERLEILEELERHHEGVDAGARRLLELARDADDPVFRSIRGLVAEQFDVDVAFAALVDTALGDRANALVVDGPELVHHLRSGKIELPGRLTILQLEGLPTKRFGQRIQLDGVPGVIGRADQLVRHDDAVTPLIQYLLGTTWLVESLDVALELSHFRGAGLRFVTAACELLESDGTLTFGAIQSASGLVSRRSEIQIARSEIADLKSQLQSVHGEVARISSHIETLSPRAAKLEQEARQLAQELARQQAAAQNAVARLDALESQGKELEEKLAHARQRRASLLPTIQEGKQHIAQLQRRVQEIEHEIIELKREQEKQAEELDRSASEETARQVDLARAEQMLATSKSMLQQQESGRQERLTAIEEATAELGRLVERAGQTELKLLQLESQLAEDFAVREAAEKELEELASEAAELRRTRSETARRADKLKQTVDSLRQRQQARQGELERSREAIEQLLTRYREDYQLTVEQIRAAECIDDPHQREQLTAEAAQLRHDVATVGEINMTALNELDELQARYDHLHGQYEDLVAAKESLQRIIHKINQDSRRMFLETLEVIRQNFQQLYRKSFGGGHADIVLEDGEDPLECGIDIIATPPGKTALSNSLLSGGEKALTAVALLLAIFQYRPSPFCVLDEVDAPFDEANIGRFVNVLHEFLDWTKFIIVTHSKKTMTAATTLYGVTMQESGVSKQVSVRFEDVNDKGEIVSKKAA